jgi:hypothetical protein
MRDNLAGDIIAFVSDCLYCVFLKICIEDLLEEQKQVVCHYSNVKVKTIRLKIRACFMKLE